MSVQSEAADAFQGRMITRSDAAVLRALRLWRQVPVSDLDAGWSVVGPQLVALFDQVAVRDAADAGRTVATIGVADRLPAGDLVVPQAFTGVDGSGRDVEGLLHGAVTTTKQAVGAGLGLADSFVSGGVYLTAMMKTALADLGRSGLSTAAAGRGYVRYVRVVNAGACSRCAILAGSDRFSRPFQRHPACRCTSVPVRDGESVPGGVFDNPGAYFDSLSPAEQDRVFTKAGAEAIRLGADPVKVVSARRGSRAGVSRAGALSGDQLRRSSLTRVRIGTRSDGSPLMGYVTGEAGTRRGSFGRAQERLSVESARVGLERYSRTTRARLMPETVMELTDDPDLRRLLLRDAGYLQHRLDYSSNAWVSEQARLELADRVAADEFYRSLGVRLS